MDVFIGNLPGKATLAELQAFLGDMKLHADVRHCNGRDHADDDYHFFVIQAVEPRRALALIERFNGRMFHGRAVEAREYICRKQHVGWNGRERRINGET
jgi:hypothetical protein